MFARGPPRVGHQRTGRQSVDESEQMPRTNASRLEQMPPRWSLNKCRIRLEQMPRTNVSWLEQMQDKAWTNAVLRRNQTEEQKKVVRPHLYTGLSAGEKGGRYSSMRSLSERSLFTPFWYKQDTYSRLTMAFYKVNKVRKSVARPYKPPRELFADSGILTTSQRCGILWGKPFSQHLGLLIS